MEGKREEIRKGPWKEEEDEVLKKHVKKYGPRDWSSIRSKGLLQRTGKSCRLRWVNKLRPNLIHGCKFSAEEERMVIEMQAQFGNKWAKIATYLPGRTDNDVKNFWSSRQKKLARVLHNSATPSSSSISKLQLQGTKMEIPVFHDLPTLEGPMFTSMEEEASSKGAQSCSSSYVQNHEALKMVPLPDPVKLELNNYDDLNPLQVEPLSSRIPFPQLPQSQPGLTFLPESHEFLARIEDPYSFNVFGPLDAPEIGDGVQLSPASQLFGPFAGCGNASNDDVKNHVTPDTLFDDFPTDMFDHIEPLPSPSKW